MNPIRILAFTALGLVKLVLLSYFCLRAFRIRMLAIETYGHVIHEFDPWFNYRATEYLAEHGWMKFFKWYDYMSWYPIGRPVGTTIYPGMQFAALWIWEAAKYVPDVKYKMPKHILSQLPKWLPAYLPNKGKGLHFGPFSLNDVCCLVPAWFGAVATVLVFLLASEVAESTSVGLFAAAIMCIIPAHIMRSMGGGFDNEAVAVSAFCLVLWLWVRSVRTPRSWPFGILAGVAYAAAAATWGGYIFINNLVAVHAALLVVLGKHNYGLYRTFTLYYVIGTYLAMCVPVIGWAPLRSVEQVPSLLVFGTFQLMQLCDIVRRRFGSKWGAWRFCGFRVMVFSVAGAAAVGVSYVLWTMGVFMPFGARIRGLFLEAVKTGNPLVDSVAEHSPANEQAYRLYLGQPRFLAVVGLLFCWHQKTPGKFLVVIYALVSYHYSLKMSRLMIICGPIVSVLAAFPVGIVFDWCFEQFLGLVSFRQEAEKAAPASNERIGGMGSIYRNIWARFGNVLWPKDVSDALESKEAWSKRWWIIDRPVRAVVAWAVLVSAWNYGLGEAKDFIKHCDEVANHMSSPQLMFKTRLQNGQEVIVDDYIRGYEWLKKNTPEDARVMAWWDYGYQITGVANRTSVADGNTWNHEHIATLGKILTSPEKRCHNAMRHLADYALVWAGGHSDDMGKSPHLARIGNSVFPDHCGDDDPLCQKFSFYQDQSPTPMMARSFLYKAVNHEVKPGVKLNPKYWKEVHTTKYGLLRIYQVMNVSQESKEWVADPKNRVCDAPGSWYCVGQYPPALEPLIKQRRNFAQLEDFNKAGQEQSAYSKLIEEQRGTKSKKGGASKAHHAGDEL